MLKFLSTPGARSKEAVPLAYPAFDLLATLVTVVDKKGTVLFSNAALEDVLGISRRSIVGSDFSEAFTQPSQLQSALEVPVAMNLRPCATTHG